MTDWSQFKPADEPAAEPGVDWSQFKPEPAKPSLFERAKSLFSSSDVPAGDPMATGASEIMAQPTADSRPVLDRPATPEQVAARPKGFSPQEMAEGSVAPWKAEQDAQVAAYGNTNRSPTLKAPGQSKAGDFLRGFDRKPLDNSLFGAVTETAGDAGRGIAKVVPSLAKSAYGAIQAGADIIGADGLSSFARSAQDAGADWLTQFDNPNGDKLVTGAFQSLGTAIAGGSIAGTSGAIALAVGQTSADKYNELRKGGIGLTDALEGATVHGVAEYLGERIGMKSLGKLVSGIASKAGIPPMAALKEFLKQQGEEQVTLAISSIYDKLGSGSLRNDLKWSDYLDDVVTTAQQTAIMTAAAAGGGRIARAASTGAQKMLTPGLAARVEPPPEPFEAGFTPMTDAGNIAPAAPATAPGNLFAKPGQQVHSGVYTTAAPVRVEDQPTTPMTPEQILSAPQGGVLKTEQTLENPQGDQAAPRVDVNNPEAVLAQLGLGQPKPAEVVTVTTPDGRIEPYLPPDAPSSTQESAKVTPTGVADTPSEAVFKTKSAATITARREGGTVIEVPGGFAVQQDAGTPATKSDSGSATPAPVAPAPVDGGSRNQIREDQPRAGTIGGKMSAGEVVTTSSGRQTTPFPKISTDTERKAGNTVRNVDQWLMQNAMAEAQSRGDDFNARQFEQNLTKPSQADKDSAEEYLFGEQPAVPRPFLKPLVDKATAQDDKSSQDDKSRTDAPPAEAANKVGDLVKLTKPGIGGRVNIAGRIERILPDGRLEIRTQQDGFMTVAASELGHKPAKATDAPTTEAPRAEAPAQGAAPATEAAADVPAAGAAPVEAAGKPAQKSPDVAAQVELRKRASVLKSLLDCMA